MAAAPAIPSIEDLLANIPGLRKGGGGAAPAAAAAAYGDAPAGKRQRKAKAADAPAPAAKAAMAPPPVHSLNVPDVTATLECPAGALALRACARSSVAADVTAAARAACVGSVIGKGGYVIKSAATRDAQPSLASAVP